MSRKVMFFVVASAFTLVVCANAAESVESVLSQNDRFVSPGDAVKTGDPGRVIDLPEDANRHYLTILLPANGERSIASWFKSDPSLHRLAKSMIYNEYSASTAHYRDRFARHVPQDQLPCVLVQAPVVGGQGGDVLVKVSNRNLPRSPEGLYRLLADSLMTTGSVESTGTAETCWRRRPCPKCPIVPVMPVQPVYPTVTPNRPINPPAPIEPLPDTVPSYPRVPPAPPFEPYAPTPTISVPWWIPATAFVLVFIVVGSLVLINEFRKRTAPAS